MGEERTLNPTKHAIRELKQQWYAELLRSCRDGIRHALDAGDHPEAWETICNGPDAGGKMRAYDKPDGKTIGYCLTGMERDGMRDDLKAFATMNGWDFDLGTENVRRLMHERRGKLEALRRRMTSEARAANREAKP